MILDGPVILLSLARLADALYFTFAYYGRVRKSRWVPAVFCAREGPSCVAVIRTTYGSVFGVPNSLLGIVYYVLLLVWALAWHSAIFGSRLGLIIWCTRFTDILIAGGATTVALAFYLIFALCRILYTDCPWCYAARGINLRCLHCW